MSSNTDIRTDAGRGFVASPELARDLQRVLVDLVAVNLHGKQAHWNVVGPNFRDLHLHLDEIVDAARVHADTIAERMRALRAVPDGRPATVAESTALPAGTPGEQATRDAVAAVTAMLRTAAGTARAVHDAVDAEDPTTADLLHAIITDLEKHAWMLEAEIQ